MSARSACATADAEQTKRTPWDAYGWHSVHDSVPAELQRDGLVNFSQEGLKFLMPVSGFAAGQYGAVENIECRKQRRSAVTNVVVGYALHVAEPHGQHGFLKRTDLTAPSSHVSAARALPCEYRAYPQSSPDQAEPRTCQN